LINDGDEQHTQRSLRSVLPASLALDERPWRRSLKEVVSEERIFCDVHPTREDISHGRERLLEQAVSQIDLKR
jgi:hypothetical protein